jgi:hypothetical protein
VWVVWGGTFWQSPPVQEILLQNMPVGLPITAIVNNIASSNFGTTIAVSDFNGAGKRDLAIDFSLPQPDGTVWGQVALIAGESLMAGGSGTQLIEVSCGTKKAANTACLNFGSKYHIVSDRNLGTRITQNAKDELIVPLRTKPDYFLELHFLDLQWKPNQVGYLDWEEKFTCLSEDVPYSGNSMVSGYDFDGDSRDDLFISGRDSQAYLLLTE